jgi:hypothetical protein
MRKNIPNWIRLKRHFKVCFLQHQYRAKNYQNYLDLIRDLLQAEKHDELTLRNHHQHSVGFAHHNVKSNKKFDGSNNHQ